MNDKHPNKVLFIFLIPLAISLLAGCMLLNNSTPTSISTGLPKLENTPPPTRCTPIIASNDTGLAILTLPDGSQIYLGADSEIEFAPAGYCAGVNADNIWLLQGQVAVNAQISDGDWIIVNSPDGYLGLISKTGMASFDPSSHNFTLACSNKNCALGTDNTKLISLNCGENGTLDAAGGFSVSSEDPTILAPFGDWLQPQCGNVVTITATPLPETETPDIAATATAFCSSFSQQFVSTPCPTSNP
jgi:FecR protein